MERGGGLGLPQGTDDANVGAPADTLAGADEGVVDAERHLRTTDPAQASRGPETIAMSAAPSVSGANSRPIVSATSVTPACAMKPGRRGAGRHKG